MHVIRLLYGEIRGHNDPLVRQPTFMRDTENGIDRAARKISQICRHGSVLMWRGRRDSVTDV